MIKVGVSQRGTRALLTRLFQAALEAVDPYETVCRQVRLRRGQLSIGAQHYSLQPKDRIVVVGAGKASARMAQALERQVGPRIETGLVVVKYGHGAPTKRIRIVEAGHPVPDAAGIRASHMMMALIGRLKPNDLLIVLLSGGASSLLPSPPARHQPQGQTADHQIVAALRRDYSGNECGPQASVACEGRATCRHYSCACGECHPVGRDWK